MNTSQLDRNYSRSRELLTTLLLCVISIGINLLGVMAAARWRLPLLLDSVGTVLAAALGGFLPGVAVSYATHLIAGLFDQTTRFYGTINIIIAFAATVLSQKGYFRKLRKLWLPVLVFTLLGGFLSCVLSWLMNGFDFGDGVSAELVARIYAGGRLGPFLSQLFGDLIIELADKLLTTLLVFLILRLLPESFRHSAHFRGWQQAPLTEEGSAAAHSVGSRGASLRAKMLVLLGVAVLLIAIVATSISYMLYRSTTIEEHTKTAQGVASLTASIIDPERVDEYIAEGEAAEGYADIEKELYAIRESSPDIQFIYVYQIRPDGCHVVFDLDTEEIEGSEPGEVVEFDESFSDFLPALLAGQPIDPIITDDTYGWLLTAYHPVYNDAGECKCYACADISMGTLRESSLRFLVQIVTMSLGFFMLVLAIGIWMAEYNIILPVNSMALSADAFAYNSEEARAGTVGRIRELDIHTGDEIENLYHALTKTTEDTVQYIASVQAKNETISRMQNGLILVLADIVESRDQCTGDHVRKTAAYTKLIMDELRKEGKFSEVLTDDYILDVMHSAPLHDIGKITVPDALLNKPGKLTDEEFLLMQKHTTAGGEIISHAIELVGEGGYLDEAKNLATYHHEKWNGTGYPTGLKGEEIPLSARIMAVADVFDALVSKRSYKDGFPVETALNIIRDSIGTHFDPDVAQAFLNAEPEVRRIAHAQIS